MYTRLIPILLAGQLLIAAAVNYSYDAAGRLTKIDYGAAGSISYTYDNAGNVTSRTVQSSGSGASAITSAQLVRSTEGESRIEIRGTNLAAEETTFTIDGKPARVLSRCNAAVSRTCKTDEVSILAPEVEATGRARIVVTRGTKSSPPFWVSIH
jgi:YD repeat-containing protein